jgi:hypothetical protein
LKNLDAVSLREEAATPFAAVKCSAIVLDEDHLRLKAKVDNQASDGF